MSTQLSIVTQQLSFRKSKQTVQVDIWLSGKGKILVRSVQAVFEVLNVQEAVAAMQHISYVSFDGF